MPIRPANLGCLLLLAGCAAVGPDFEAPELPAYPAWLEAELETFDATPAELANWWQILNDPVLDQLVETAHRQNNSLQIAGLRVLEARAALDIALGSRYPQTQVAVGDATAVGASESAANTAAGDLDFVQYNVGATASWEIDFWGRFRRGIEAADANLARTEADFEDLLVLLTAQVVDVYATIRATEEQLRLARESLGIQQRSYDIVELLYESGDTSELDALQARALLLSSEATIPSLEAALRQAKNALAALLGVTPDQADAVLGEDESVPDAPDSLNLGIPADLLRQRPDVRSAELAARAQNARVGVATADLYPSFSLNGYLGLAAADATDTTRTGDSGIGELFRSESLTYSAGASFVWPFFNYGRIRSNIRVEDARLQQALVAWRETVIQAQREVEDATVAYRSALQQDRILAESVLVARRSADLSLLRYQEGFADYQRVLDSQQRLFNQQQRYAANLGAIVRGVSSVYRSLGGGWQAVQAEFVDEATREQLRQRTDWGDLLDTSATSSGTANAQQDQ